MDTTYQDVGITIKTPFNTQVKCCIREVKLANIKNIADGFILITFKEKNTNIKHELLVPRIEGLTVAIE